jgi:anti-sigma regulatory factor (Ser/Thr protein kinase)
MDEESPVVLPAEAGSAGRARRHLRRALERAAGTVPDAVADDAEVCLSELVTNALLHAGTAMTVSVHVSPSVLRLEVRDGSQVVPQWVPRSLTASTGRGLPLITALSSARGGDVHPDGGKTVWCELPLTGDDRDEGELELGAALQDEIDALLAADWESLPEPAPTTPGAVRLLRYPLRRGVRLREHREAVLRELRLLSLTHAITDPASAALAGEVADQLAAQYAGHLKPAQVQVLQALGAGEDSADLDYPRLPDHLGLLDRWRRNEEELDRLIAATGVAVLAAPPDLRELTDWMLAEFVHQLTGGDPRPWPGPLD